MLEGGNQREGGSQKQGALLLVGDKAVLIRVSTSSDSACSSC